jgi:hypothetical protein
MCREEVDRRYKGGSLVVLRVRSRHGNDLDCSGAAVSARRRGLGIFAVAALTHPPNEHLRVLFDPLCDGLKEIGSEFNTIIHC